MSSSKGLATTRSVKITFNREWTDRHKQGLVIAEAERRIPWCSSLRKVYCSTHRTDWYCSPARVCTACVWTVTRQPEESVQLTARHRVTAVLSTCLFCFGPVYSDLSTQMPPPPTKRDKLVVISQRAQNNNSVISSVVWNQPLIMMILQEYVQ